MRRKFDFSTLDFVDFWAHFSIHFSTIFRAIFQPIFRADFLAHFSILIVVWAWDAIFRPRFLGNFSTIFRPVFRPFFGLENTIFRPFSEPIFRPFFENRLRLKVFRPAAVIFRADFWVDFWTHFSTIFRPHISVIFHDFSIFCSPFCVSQFPSNSSFPHLAVPSIPPFPPLSSPKPSVF